MNATDQRMFYLMLSPTEGQKYADTMGYAPPSEDVQELEVIDVMSRWITLYKTNILEDIMETTDWFVTLLSKVDKLSSPPDEFKAALTVFSASMLNRLMDNGKLGLFVDPELLEDLENE